MATNVRLFYTFPIQLLSKDIAEMNEWCFVTTRMPISGPVLLTTQNKRAIISIYINFYMDKDISK